VARRTGDGLVKSAIHKNHQSKINPNPAGNAASKHLVVHKEKDVSPDQVIPMDDDFKDF